LAWVVLEQLSTPRELVLWRMSQLPLMQVGCLPVNRLKIVLDKPLRASKTASTVSLEVQRIYAVMTDTTISPRVSKAHPPGIRQQAERQDMVTGVPLLNQATEALLQAAHMRMREKNARIVDNLRRQVSSRSRSPSSRSPSPERRRSSSHGSRSPSPPSRSGSPGRAGEALAPRVKQVEIRQLTANTGSSSESDNEIEEDIPSEQRGNEKAPVSPLSKPTPSETPGVPVNVRGFERSKQSGAARATLKTWSQLETEIRALSELLEGVRTVRVKQQEYLQRLVSGPPSTHGR